MLNEFKAPLWVKLLLGVIAFGLFLGTVLFYSSREKKNRESFFKHGFSTVIISSNTYYYQARFTEFHLENGLRIYVSKLSTKNIRIDDMVVKKRDSYIYALYKKNKLGEYELFATYNFTDVD